MPRKCRGYINDRREAYIIKVINCALDMNDALVGNECNDDNFDIGDRIEECKNAPIINKDISYAYMSYSHNNSLLKAQIVGKRVGTRARLEMSYAKDIPV